VLLPFANGGLFYPVTPNREEECWRRFFEEAYDRFLAGSYRGGYEAALVSDFEAALPDTPPWKQPGPRSAASGQSPSERERSRA